MADKQKTNWLVDMFKKTSTGKKLDTRKSKIDKIAQPEDAPVKESDETQAYRDEQIRKKEDKAGAPKPYKKGGYVRAADGCAKRGKTKGRFV
jgi:hypothetical protein